MSVVHIIRTSSALLLVGLVLVSCKQESKKKSSQPPAKPVVAQPVQPQQTVVNTPPPATQVPVATPVVSCYAAISNRYNGADISRYVKVIATPIAKMAGADPAVVIQQFSSMSCKQMYDLYKVAILDIPNG